MDVGGRKLKDSDMCSVEIAAICTQFTDTGDVT